MPTKANKSYHHGNLRRALLSEALRIIAAEGVAGLTLRAVGDRLGVSRTALYRHFADKAALLAAVACDGFRAFRHELSVAWTRSGGGVEGFEAMALAYTWFALANPSHYRVMFGTFRDECARDHQLVAEAKASFEVLMAALASLQDEGVVRRDDLATLAHFVWAASHGIAMLAIDGQLGSDVSAAESLTRYTTERLLHAIAPS